MRIATGGISHETSSFAVKKTTLDDFANGFGLFRGDEVIQRFRGANICTGGFIEGSRTHGFELVPLLWGFAYPSGTIVRKDYELLKEEFLQRLRQDEATHGRIDGVLLDLHGAMVIEEIPDGDGDFIEAIRNYLGDDRPIVVTFDLHGNHTLRRVNAATAIVGFDTYPHIDMAERGREAADLIVKTIRHEIEPVMAFRSIPLFWHTPTQVTANPPMVEVIQFAHELERRQGILAVTIATGFPWADVPDVGASVIIVADRDATLASHAADEFSNWIWEQRERWYCPPKSVRDAIREGEIHGRYPIVLADHADNTGGGSPGDSTEILETFLDMGLSDALILYIVDPDVAKQAHAAGVGKQIDVLVGGKSADIQGPPVQMHATVMAVSHGDFTYDGPMYAGLTGNMGCSAWLKQDGVSVVVVTANEQPLGPAFAKTLGIDCRSMKYISVKSSAHFRASFEPIAGIILNVDAKAIHTHEFPLLRHQLRTRPVFPVEILPRDLS
ncbi:M81 family metallopeptidase [Schlesneria paludicola]|uniref:M81 family metallopeptidase n=1 Tax=Schlesneria paludicola TaxID=360056 RepID=UPI00029A99A0|nr:M81 family metallopeptidase [Schlesneria paludicola]